MKKSAAPTGESAAVLIDGRIKELNDWRGERRALTKKAVKLTFAFLKDPKKLFNSSLEGNTWRVIDFSEGSKIDAAAFNSSKAK